MEPVSLSQPVIAPAPAFAGVLGLTRASALVCRCVRSFPVAAQSLPRDLTLSPSGRLLQSWVPELQTMRAYAPQQQGLQLEILARFKINPDRMLTESSSHKQTPRFGFTVLGVAGTDEATHVGVDLDVGIFFIDGRKSNSCDAIPWQCPHQPPHPPAAPAAPSLRVAGLYPAGPLLGSKDAIDIHCYVDAVFVSCIFNNETAITAMVNPSEEATAPVASFGAGGGVQVASLEAWRLALPERDVRPSGAAAEPK